MIEMYDSHPDAVGVHPAHHLGVQRDLLVRLADPCLTDRDRWILCQLAWFFGGIAPDARLERVVAGPARHLRASPSGRRV